MNETEKWEYFCNVYEADISNPGVQEYIKQKIPNWKCPTHWPITLNPYLNKLGEEGWELLQIEPVFMKENGLVERTTRSLFDETTNRYLCTFKRKIIE